jgi:hypothetical protein
VSEPGPPEEVEPLPGAEPPAPPPDPPEDEKEEVELPIGGEPVGAPPPEPLVARTSGSDWPDVMGVIAIILGAIGILSKMGAAFYPFIRPVAVGLFSRNVPPGTIESFFGFLPDTMVVMLSGLIEMGLAVLLLIGGIFLKNRRRLGVQLLKIWAWISIPWALLETGLANVLVRRMLPSLPHLDVIDFPMGGFIHAGVIFGLIISLAVPIFVLAWFGGRSVSAEISSWPE